ncbi:ATP-binding protein [Vreelandella populi]|uniref:ATP-binding protein n=1 Tax=Vreelandella populi TaxID=2498858 RepID=UPI000F8E8E4B|nr:ATP-binding protein [Halomonas populi]RUR52725.1 cell division protein ZapE [Halomonas populi]
MSSKGLVSSLMDAESATKVCDSHGDYQSMHIVFGKTDTWSGCPECAEEKRQRDQVKEFEENRKIAAQKRLESRIGYACLPPRFAGKNFDSYRADTEQQKKYLENCKQYAENFPEHLKSGDGLMLLGNPGTGKTHLAVAALNYIVQHHGEAGLYTTAARMFRRIKDTYTSKDETESQAIDAFASPALLVLDEVGVSFGSDAELNYLFDIMNERYEQCLPTIIVSNVQPGDLGQWVGDRVVDRLRECSKLMVFNWESARRELGRGAA